MGLPARIYVLMVMAAGLGLGSGLAGCTGGDGGDGPRYDAGLAPGGDDCAAGCNWLLGCELCDADFEGRCLEPTACAARCRERGDQPIYACLSTLDYCDASQIEDCYAVDVDDPPAEGEDGCAAGCNTLRACGDCILDAGGDCLPTRSCAAACRAGGQQLAYQCVADAEQCGDAILDECFEIQPPADGCEAGCRALDGCGLGLPGDDGELLSLDACVAQCREDEDDVLFGCYAEVEACDDAGYAACDEAKPTDGCALGCQALDDCGFGLPGDDGEILSPEACAVQCRADGDEVLLQCYAEVEDCSDDGYAMCDAVEPPAPDPGCAAGCEAVANCGFDCGAAGCATCGGEDEAACPTAEDCAAACEAAGTGRAFACLGEVDGCAAEAIAACYVPPDICTLGCTQLDDCGYAFTDEDDEFLDIEACVDQCRDGDPADRAIELCVAGLPMCVDEEVEACFDVELDPCGAACIFLEDCVRCAPDGAAGCLTTLACVAACRADENDLGACLADAVACDAEAVDTCLGGPAPEPEPQPEPDPPEPEPQPEPEPDPCVDACATPCDPCLPGADGCLTAEDCRMACAAADAACVDAINACDAAAYAEACAP